MREKSPCQNCFSVAARLFFRSGKTACVFKPLCRPALGKTSLMANERGSSPRPAEGFKYVWLRRALKRVSRKSSQKILLLSGCVGVLLYVLIHGVSFSLYAYLSSQFAHPPSKVDFTLCVGDLSGKTAERDNPTANSGKQTSSNGSNINIRNFSESVAPKQKTSVASAGLHQAQEGASPKFQNVSGQSSLSSLLTSLYHALFLPVGPDRPAAQPARDLGDSATQASDNKGDGGREDNNDLQHKLLSLRVLPDEGYLAANASIFRPRSEVVNSFVPNVTIQVSSPCPDSGPFLLVAVPSVPGHSSHRKAIRNTWGGLAYGRGWPGKKHALNYDVRLLFFLGVQKGANLTSLKAESSRYGDIVMGDFVENYRNLSLKMVFALHWIVSHCKQAQHVMKVDEDTFVNVPPLLDFLQAVSLQHSRYIVGYRHSADKPLVVRHGRWQVDEKIYPLRYYPAYLLGHSYVISGAAVPDLYYAYQRTPLVPSEDSYLTGILAKSMGVLRIHSPHFAGPRSSDRCELVAGKFLSQTYFNLATDLYETWLAFMTGMCPQDESVSDQKTKETSKGKNLVAPKV